MATCHITETKGNNMKQSKKVLFWDDERKIGNSLIVTLNYGWRFAAGDVGEHVMGFDTIKEANQAVSESVKCECDECLAGHARPISIN